MPSPPDVGDVEPSRGRRWADLRRAFVYLRPHRRALACVVGIAGISAAAALMPPLLLRALIDGGLMARDAAALAWATGLLVAVHCARAGLGALESWLSVRTGASVIRDLRMDMYRRMRDMSASYHAARDTGEVNARFGADAVSAQAGIGRLFPDLVRSVVGLVLAIAIIWSLDHRLALVATAFVPVYWLSTAVFARKVERRERAASAESARLTTHLNSSLGPKGILITQGVRRTGLDLASMEACSASVARSREWLALWGSIHRESLTLTTGCATAAIYGYGLYLHIGGQCTIGTVVACAVYFGRMTAPVSTFSDAGLRLTKALASLGRIFSFIDQPRAAAALAARPLPSATAPALALHAVSFVHRSAAGDVAIEFPDLRIAGHGITLVQGESGAGKTTLAHLLCGLGRPTSGRIVLCGLDAAGLTRDQIAGLCDYVAAESTLFKGSILHNVTLGDESAIADAAALLAELGVEAGDDDDTAVAEFGANLSAGQRQRIALARAVLGPCPLLVVDEPFANLDPVNAERTLRVLNRAAQRKLIVVISHQSPRGLDVRATVRIGSPGPEPRAVVCGATAFEDARHG